MTFCLRWSGKPTGQSWQEKNSENSDSIFPPLYYLAVIKIHLRKMIFSVACSCRKITMKLLTHNMLTSKCMKAVTTGYPLAIQARDVKVVQIEEIHKHAYVEVFL